jgi:hypothetical protein
MVVSNDSESCIEPTSDSDQKDEKKHRTPCNKYLDLVHTKSLSHVRPVETGKKTKKIHVFWEDVFGHFS